MINNVGLLLVVFLFLDDSFMHDVVDVYKQMPSFLFLLDVIGQSNSLYCVVVIQSSF